MQSLILRIITIASAGLLMYEVIKGEHLVHLDTSNAVDSIIIIVAMTGLLVGIFTPEKQISNSANPDPTSATPTTVRTENSEGGKSGQE
jgi:hypothetical protein